MNLADNPDRLLIEAEQINCALLASEAYMRTLTEKREEIMNVLDTLTRPEGQSTVSLRRTVRRGFEYLDEYSRCPNYIRIYFSILARLWKDFPEKREEMAREVRRSAYSRRYVAQDRMSLFTGMPNDWTVKHSTELCDGWYVDTNVNKKQIHMILRRAVAAAGLKWGSDVRVYWETQTI